MNGSYDDSGGNGWRYRGDSYGCGSGSTDRADVWRQFAKSKSLQLRHEFSILSEGTIADGKITLSDRTTSVPIELGLLQLNASELRLSTYITGIASYEAKGRIVARSRGMTGDLFEKIRAMLPGFKAKPPLETIVIINPDDPNTGWPGDDVRELLGVFSNGAELSQDGNIVKVTWPDEYPNLRTLDAATEIVLTVCRWHRSPHAYR